MSDHVEHDPGSECNCKWKDDWETKTAPLSLRERIDLAKWLVESVEQCDETNAAVIFIAEQAGLRKAEAAG